MTFLAKWWLTDRTLRWIRTIWVRCTKGKLSCKLSTKWWLYRQAAAMAIIVVVMVNIYRLSHFKAKMRLVGLSMTMQHNSEECSTPKRQWSEIRVLLSATTMTTMQKTQTRLKQKTSLLMFRATSISRRLIMLASRTRARIALKTER